MKNKTKGDILNASASYKKMLRYICLVGLSVFAYSATALDLGDLDFLAAGVKRGVKELSKPKANTNNFCDRVQSNEVYKQFAQITGDAIRGHYYYDDEKNPRLLDSKDHLLTEWMKKNFSSDIFEKNGHESDSVSEEPIWLFHTSRSMIDGSQFDEYLIEDNVVHTLEQCADQLLDSDFAYIFFRPYVVEKLRKLHSENLPSNKPPTVEVVREISSNGEIVEKKVAHEVPKNSNYETARINYLFKRGYAINKKSQTIIAPGYPHWLALIYGGEKF